MTALQSGWASAGRHRRSLLIIAAILAVLLLLSGTPQSLGHLGITKPVIPFELEQYLWADGGPSPIPVKTIPTFADPLKPKKWGMKVPDVVHYIMLARPDGSVEMDYRQYLAIRSALVVQSPEAIYVHYDILPTGMWWDQLTLEPSIQTNKVIPPLTIWGQPLELAAHRSDIIRLYALKAMGGVYLDLDVFVLRALDELYYEPFTMGLEEEKYTKMGNAVIISAPSAPFIDRWMVGYQDFRPQHYAYNGVVKPLEIARAHPDELRLLNATAFFYPQWWHNEKVFRTTEFDWDTHTGYTYHAWGSLHNHLKDLNPEKVLDVDTSFHRLLRRYMGERDLELWRETMLKNPE